MTLRLKVSDLMLICVREFVTNPLDFPENAIPTIELEDEGPLRQHSQSLGCGDSRDTSIEESSSADQEKATDRAASEESSSSTSVEPREEPTPSTDEDFELIAEADDMQALSDSIEHLLYKLDEDLPLPDKQNLLVRTVHKLASQYCIMAATLDRGLRVAEKVLQQPHPRAKMCAQEHIGYIAHLKSTQGHQEQVKSFFLQIEQLNENPESASRIAKEVLEAQHTCNSRHHYLTMNAEHMQTRYLDAPAEPEDAIPKWTWGSSDSDTSKGRSRKPQMLAALQ